MKVRLVQNRSGRLGKQLLASVWNETSHHRAHCLVTILTELLLLQRLWISRNRKNLTQCKYSYNNDNKEILVAHSFLPLITVTTQHCLVSLSSLSTASCHCHHSAVPRVTVTTQQCLVSLSPLSTASCHCHHSAVPRVTLTTQQCLVSLSRCRIPAIGDNKLISARCTSNAQIPQRYDWPQHNTLYTALRLALAMPFQISTNSQLTIILTNYVLKQTVCTPGTLLINHF